MIGNGYEWMQCAVDGKEWWGSILGYCRWQVESLKGLQAWLRWDSSCRRSTYPTKATTRGVEGTTKPWKVTTFELWSFPMLPFSNFFPSPPWLQIR
jgi:hypothetical protein